MVQKTGFDEWYKKPELKEFFTENSNDYQYFTSCPNIKRFLISLVLTVTLTKTLTLLCQWISFDGFLNHNSAVGS